MAAAVALPRLPPPGGSQQEVLFRRMLLQCSARAPAGAPSQKDDGTTPDWRTDPKFHCIVEALQEKLYELQQAGPEVRLGPDVLDQYQAAVLSISSQLQPPQLPAYCWRVSTQDRLAGVQAAAQAGGGGSSNSSSANHNTQARASRSKQPGRLASERDNPQQQQQQQQQNSTTSTSGRLSGAGAPGSAAAAAGSGPGEAAPNFSMSSRAHQVLATQQRLQDELTDELLDMGAELKSSTLAMQNAIRYRGKLLDDAETHLVHSTENAKAVAAKAKEQYRQGNWNLCHTCIIVLTVVVVFTVMIVYIRLSSMVGLGGR